MNYEHKETRANGDATCNYEVVGKFPVPFREFLQQILTNTNSFSVKFAATNECFGGWLGNRIEMYKSEGADTWYLVKQNPSNWLNEIANMKVTKCWANGGWGQMTYFCTFNMEDNNEL